MTSNVTTVGSSFNQRDADASAIWHDAYPRIESRMRKLASQLLARSTAVSRWEQTDDVLQESLIRVLQAIRQTEIQSTLHLYRLAALQVRRVLIDLARKHKGPRGLATHHRTGTHIQQLAEQVPEETPGRPLAMEEWSDFHRLVSQLPDQHRETFDLIWYADLATSEAAAILGVSQRTMQQRWRNARIYLCQRWKAEVGGAAWPAAGS